MGEQRDRLRRGWAQRLASTGRIAASAARLATRQVLGQQGDTGGQIGERLAQELDQMKGVAMKVGQILSYLDGVLPEETHAALRHLQRGGEPMAAETVVQVIRDAFGMEPEQAFARFDVQPVAAASIGQVHRGRFAGREVAIKVQYPGVRDTMVADVSRLRSLSHLASLATAVDGPSVVDELAERFRLECDYELEARTQNAFRAALAHEPQVCIPEAVMARTRATVLTTAWCTGDSLYTFAEQAPAPARQAAALTLMRFGLRCLFGAGVVNADPHPGNYLFPPDGTVVFLDFGCVRRFDPELMASERQLARILLDDNRAAFRDAVMVSGMVADSHGFDFDLHWQMLCHLYEPYRRRRFHFTRQYLRDGMAYNGPGNPNLRRLAIPPQWIWVQRLLWGLHAVLVRLDAQGEFGEVLRAALDEPWHIEV